MPISIIHVHRFASFFISFSPSLSFSHYATTSPHIAQLCLIALSIFRLITLFLFTLSTSIVYFLKSMEILIHLHARRRTAL